MISTADEIRATEARFEDWYRRFEDIGWDCRTALQKISWKTYRLQCLYAGQLISRKRFIKQVRQIKNQVWKGPTRPPTPKAS